MTSDNKQIARTIFDRMNTGDLTGAAAFFAEDLVNHSALPDVQGRSGWLTIMSKVRTAFPDQTHAVEDLIAGGDRVRARLSVSGTQTAPPRELAIRAVAAARYERGELGPVRRERECLGGRRPRRIDARGELVVR